MNKQLNLWKEQSDDNKLLIAKLLDKIKFTKNKNKFETTDFLDLREQAILTEEINRIKFEQYKLLGGYDNSERKIILLFPEKIELDYIDNTVFDQFLTIIRVKLPNELKGQLEHRNYLGGLMKLGIKRDKIGDIIVRDDGADIIVKNEISEYIKNNIQSLSRFKKSELKHFLISKFELTIKNGYFFCQIFLFSLAYILRIVYNESIKKLRRMK